MFVVFLIGGKKKIQPWSPYYSSNCHATQSAIWLIASGRAKRVLMQVIFHLNKDDRHSNSLQLHTLNLSLCAPGQQCYIWAATKGRGLMSSGSTHSRFCGTGFPQTSTIIFTNKKNFWKAINLLLYGQNWVHLAIRILSYLKMVHGMHTQAQNHRTIRVWVPQ